MRRHQEKIQWRCAYGTHPFSSRTRWLRRKRPMVLCWRRHGRAGGCWIINREDPRGYLWGLSSVGRAPALQAGGREFESLSLQCRERPADRTLKTEYCKEIYSEKRRLTGSQKTGSQPAEKIETSEAVRRERGAWLTKRKKKKAERYPPKRGKPNEGSWEG